MGLFDAIRRFFGIHIHEWGTWYPIYCSDRTVTGFRRKCSTCTETDDRFYPEGH
jgi:hypothetical protein